MKKTTTINIEKPILDFLDAEARRLSISRNELLEAHTILYHAKCGMPSSTAQIQDFVDSFPLKKRGNTSPNFRSTIKGLTTADSWTLAIFYTALNLIEGMEVSISRFSNIWKHGDTVAYFCYGDKIGRMDVADLLAKQAGNVDRSLNRSAGGPFYFSCLQQLLHIQSYPKWADFLRILTLPANTAIVEVDAHNLLHTVLPALEEL